MLRSFLISGKYTIFGSLKIVFLEKYNTGKRKRYSVFFNNFLGSTNIALKTKSNDQHIYNLKFRFHDFPIKWNLDESCND